MFLEYVKFNYYARFHAPGYHTVQRKTLKYFIRREILTKSMEVKGTRSWCVLVEYVKDNYYARFHDPSYHRYRERRCSILLDVKF